VATARNEEHGDTKIVKRDTTLAEYMASFRSGDQGYLKQFPLFDEFTELESASGLPELWGWMYPFRTTYLWAGGKGAMTGFHNDDEENVLCQIEGQKTVYMMPPTARSALRVNCRYDSGTECCDSTAADVMDHPALQTFVLHPGDMLYIPKYWFHEVHTTGDASISINGFASSVFEHVTIGGPRFLGVVLHALGLYYARKCVCCDPELLKRRRQLLAVLMAAGIALVSVRFRFHWLGLLATLRGAGTSE
jgi:hypothetical protein